MFSLFLGVSGWVYAAKHAGLDQCLKQKSLEQCTPRLHSSFLSDLLIVDCNFTALANRIITEPLQNMCMKLKNCSHIKIKGNFSTGIVPQYPTVLPSHASSICTVSPTVRDNCFSVFAAKFHFTKIKREKGN